MKISFTVFYFLLIACFIQAKAFSTKNFDKKDYYNILKIGSIDAIDKQISLINTSNVASKDAFEGTLLMRKAGLLKKPKDKLDAFKNGRIKLETAIQSDSNNVEFRFMRLIIQEHAPKLVKYQSQIQTDAGFITQNFKKLSSELQDIIIDYSKNSKALQQKDLQQA